jgi:hypothetical protein
VFRRWHFLGPVSWTNGDCDRVVRAQRSDMVCRTRDFFAVKAWRRGGMLRLWPCERTTRSYIPCPNLYNITFTSLPIPRLTLHSKHTTLTLATQFQTQHAQWNLQSHHKCHSISLRRWSIRHKPRSLFLPDELFSLIKATVPSSRHLPGMLSGFGTKTLKKSRQARNSEYALVLSASRSHRSKR